MGIEPLALSSVLGGLGALWLLGALVAAWAVHRRVRASRRARVDGLVRSLCSLTAQLAADRRLARLLVDFVDAPETLERADRVRARAWFDSARRLHRLLDAALAEARPGEVPRSAWVPSMGESVVSQGLLQSQRSSTSAAPAACSNLTLIDPEFQAWIEAIRDARGAEASTRPFA